jgi:hypothetical protein
MELNLEQPFLNNTVVAWFKISQVVVFSLCGIKILCVPPPAEISTLPLVKSAQQ